MFITRILPLLLCFLLISACAEKKIIPDPVSPEAALMAEADQYWDAGDYFASQRLYQRLSAKPELTPRQQTVVWHRLGKSAYYNRDFQIALHALARWAEHVPSVKKSWQWHEMYSLSLKETLGEEIYLAYVNDLIRDMMLPFEIRKKAALILFGVHFEQENYPEAMWILEMIYGQIDTEDGEKYLEKAFHEYLNQFPPARLKSALPFLDQEKINQFPLNVFFWTLYSMQLEEDPSLWESLWPKLSALSLRGEFIDQAPYKKELEEWLERLGMPETEIVLLLPLSGQFSSSGWKILRGAGVAHWEMLLNGHRNKIRTINTDEHGWLDKLKSMESVSIVGGPVSRDSWQEITSSGLNREKVFFTFLPSIDNEGVTGWRFFSSPRDQVRAMIDRSVEDLGFTDFAVFYPQDDFGRAYAQIFWEEATKKGVRISGLQSYPENEPERWNSVVASFLNVKGVDSAGKNPSPDFQAVFIPDSLSRVKGLIPQFFYFDQNQLVFMGPMLWSQAYSPDTLEQQYFSLSMTTGAWLDDHPSPGARELKSLLDKTLQGDPDLWVALGYDFVRFASGLGNIPSPEQHEGINQQLANMNFNDWSMPPISWNEQGMAFQDLYVLQMNRSGLALADMEYLNSLILIREARKAHWIETLREKAEEELP